MSRQFAYDKRVEFVIGDMRDKARLSQSLVGFDCVVYAAATKFVPTAEIDPSESIKTNINGAMNLTEACKENDVKRVVALSTDKASAPINLYGAKK